MKLSSFVFGAIPLIIQHYARKYMEDDKVKTLDELQNDFGIPRIQTYDFIIVGGGTAGCVVAGRLSERFNVLLLEAGGTPVPPATVSYFTRMVASDPDINYFYKSIPQRNMSLGNGGIAELETGKMLGGSGSHNEMVHQRGSPLDWDSYAAMTGDASWRYENILQFFKKSENFIGELMQPDQSDYYGVGGPLTVDTYMPTISDKWMSAGVELGYEIADPNGLQIPSFGPIVKLIGNGSRVSTYTGYIKPFEGSRANLTVLRYSTVTKVLLDENNRAYGVAYLRHGIPQIAHTSKEVILSAGAINSPIILMMSGIGPRQVLEEAQIPVKLDLPAVGRNLNDHIWFMISGFTFNASASPYIPRILEEDLESAFTTYLETGEGQLGEAEAGPQAFYTSSRAIEDGETGWSDGRITIQTTCPLSFSDDVDSWSACFHMELDRMQSRGSVSLNVSAYLNGVIDMSQLAEIDFNGFSVASDMEVALDGIDLVFRIMEETEAFRSIGSTYSATAITGCTHLPFRSREYWTCYVQQRGTTAIHTVGTCAMGAVTDSKLRVMGVPGLRVVDASVLPTTPNANINGPVILVGEKAADDISLQWGGLD